MIPSEFSLGGHWCGRCECGFEHGCICGWCNLTPEEEEALKNWKPGEP